MRPGAASGVRSLARGTRTEIGPMPVVDEVLVGSEMGFQILREQALCACAQHFCEHVRRLGGGLIDRDHGGV